MQRTIAKQSVHPLDAVLLTRAGCKRATHRRRYHAPALNQRDDRSQQCSTTTRLQLLRAHIHQRAHLRHDAHDFLHHHLSLHR